MFSKFVKIKLTKYEKNDKVFVLPSCCIYCGSNDVEHVMIVYNQHKTSSSRIIEMIFGIFYALFAFLNQDNRDFCLAYACEHCQNFVELRQKKRKWLLIKLLLTSIVAIFIWLLLATSYDKGHFSGNIMLTLSIIYVISWLIGIYLWIKRFEIKIRQQYQLTEMSLAPDLVLKNLNVFPVGLTWSQQQGRFRMTATIGDVDYLQQLIEANQEQCTIHYSKKQLNKLKQARPLPRQFFKSTVD
ncbi:hypothetical protein QUF74_11575 [Candidatus Halobeggiatoa sp. HSG11]|nr:hypothetical protein [Candidatus Halobeggiatoa sp. HSG11]